MSLKSFDDFCAKIVNNDPIEQKAIFDERQSIVRSQITIRALWAFVIMTSINLTIMECGLQWCGAGFCQRRFSERSRICIGSRQTPNAARCSA